MTLDPARPLSICMVASSYPRFPGDIAGTFVASLAAALVARGHRVAVVAPAHPAAVPAPPGDPVPVHHFHYSPLPGLHPMGYGEGLVDDQRLRRSAHLLALPYLVSGALATLRTARTARAGIIHAHWVVPNGPVARIASRALHQPLVVTLHGSDAHIAARHPLLRAAAGRTLRAAAAVTACSPDLADAAVALGAAPQRTSLVAWGADPARFGTGDGGRWRNQLAIPCGAPVIAAAGRTVAKKGFEVLLRAFAALEGHPKAVLVIGGEGPQRPALARLAGALGVATRVRLPGRVPWDQMPDFLAMATVFTVPSVRDATGNLDGLPTVLLEAMAAGRPVVASHIAGIPLVVDSERDGLLIHAGDAAALTAALARLLAEPELQTRLGSNARRRVETELNWDAVAAHYEAVYRAALEAPCGP